MSVSEADLRKKRCCFTGHRPEKLHSLEQDVCVALGNAIEAAYHDGYRTFITGMARGVDIWAAELVINLREKHSDVHLICALPHPDFELRWSSSWQEHYHSILRRADLVRLITSVYQSGCYQRRNEWMVDHANRLVAVYNGSSGGTRNTIDYAIAQGIEVRYVLPR